MKYITMKQIKQHIINLSLILALGLSLSSQAQATESQRTFKKEGIEKHLTSEEIKDLLEWAETSNELLKDLLVRLSDNDFSKQEEENILVREIESIVSKSTPKRNELLMRYALNRGLDIYEMFKKVNKTNTSLRRRVRILKMSAKLALQYYESDVVFLEGSSSSNPIAFANFGIDYSKFLIEFSKSEFHAKAQYELHKRSLEYLQNDLNKDSHRKSRYAASILKINRFLEDLPEDSANVYDQKLIQIMRRIKTFMRRLSLDTASKTIKKQTERNGDPQVLYFEQCLLLTDGFYWGNEKDSMLNKCFEKFKHKISYEQCVALTDGFHWVNGKDSMLNKCFEKFKHKISYEQCVALTDGFHWGNGKDSMLNKCFEKFKHKISYKQCLSLTDGFHWGNEKDSMLNKCFEKFKHKISYKQCLSLTDGFHWGNGKDSMLNKCFEKFKHKISYKQCLSLTDRFHWRNGKDSMLNKCILETWR